jgi:hypothetical protein
MSEIKYIKVPKKVGDIWVLSVVKTKFGGEARNFIASVSNDAEADQVITHVKSALAHQKRISGR